MEHGSINWSQVTSLTPASHSSLDCPCQNHDEFHPLASFSNGGDWAYHSLCCSFQDWGDPGNVIWLRRILYFSDTLVVYQDSREVHQEWVGRLHSKARLVGGCGWVAFTRKDLEISEGGIACGAWAYPASVLTKLIPPPFACWVCHAVGSSILMPLPFCCSRGDITWNYSWHKANK